MRARSTSEARPLKLAFEVEGSSGSRVIGSYRVVRLLGEGAAGEVYEAEGPSGARVALKLLSGLARNIDASALVGRFKRELDVCSKLDGPHVVSVVDFGAVEGVPYLVMRLLRGETLEACVERNGPLPPDVVATIGVQACLGLESAHAARIVHRDLKPANVFLEDLGDRAVRVVLCDFGIAKAYDEDGSLTASGAILGTPLFMAPEQLTSAKDVDARADVWGLAMTLYHALTGQTPFDSLASFGDLVVALASCNVRPPEEVAPWIPPALAGAVRDALQPRDLRTPTVTAFRRVLEEAASSVTLTKASFRPLTAAERVPRSPGERDARTLSGGYRVGRQLGAGGMGAVFEASAADGSSVAIKVIRPDIAEKGESARRFLRETRAVRAIDSVHVTRLLDAKTDEATGAPFIVMELLRGRDLGALIREAGPLEPGPAAALFVEACEGVAAAHACGIVHRDLKPANLFVHEAGERVCLKVCDFGIAKHASAIDIGDASTDLTRTGGMLGSPVYMSPEQARNAKLVDHRTDVWSLALSLYEVLSGDRPWPGRTSMGEIILAICTEQLPPLTTLAPWVDPALAAIVHRGLAKDPRERWNTMRELAAALETFAKQRPLSRADLIHVDARRIAQRPRPDAWSAGSTSQGVSGEAQRSIRSVRRTVAVGAAVALVGGGLAFGTVRAANILGKPTRAAAAHTSAPGSASASALPVVTAVAAHVSASAPAAPAVIADAGVVRTTAPARTAAPSKRLPTADAAPPASSATASSAATVGRGGIATELPP